MKTATVSTTICRKTREMKSQTITENEGTVDSETFYLPLVKILYEDMKKKGLI